MWLLNIYPVVNSFIYAAGSVKGTFIPVLHP